MLGSKFNRQVSSLIQNAFKQSTKTKITRAMCKQTTQQTLRAVSQAPNTSAITRAFSTTPIVNQQSGSDKQELFHIEDCRDKGFLILKLNKGPVNSLNLEFLTALNIQLDKIEHDATVKGVIVTSSCPNIFSAGLDILEMYNSQPERIRQFWSALQDFWMKLYGSSKIYIAAINGHSPAGGCLMSISCDYRVMATGPYRIGLNETLLGITAPFWFKDTMVNTVGHRETELALQLGKLYSAEEALKVGLVDEVCNLNEVLPKAKEQMAIWCKIPEHARALTKSSMRQETISYLMSQKEADIQHFLTFITKDSIQKSLKMYLDMLKKPKKPKA